MKMQALVNTVKDLLLNSIGILRDEGFQRRVWFRGDSPEVCTYIDTACHFLDRSKSIFTDLSCIEQLGEENYSQLKKLRSLVKEHVGLTEDRINVDELREDELLDDPNWHDIQALSEDIYVKLTDFVRRHGNESSANKF